VITRLRKRATGFEAGPDANVLSETDATVPPLIRAVIVVPRQLSSARLLALPWRTATARMEWREGRRLRA
jgi:hypothetical protein